MIHNIIFDFGSVLVDWNPHHLFDKYFNDPEKTEYFLQNVCPYEWNATVDAGRPTQDAMAERIALYPEWENEIKMYFGQWIGMMNGQIPGMEAVVRELKERGYRLFGLSNWSAETFPLIREDTKHYPVFELLDAYVISGQEHCKKPDERIYKILLERFGLKAEECLFIDDNSENIAAAEALGIKGLVFTSVEQLKMDLRAILQ